MILYRSVVEDWVKWRRSRRLVLVNGCFDILHIGHVRLLQQARAQGDCLLVLLNSDSSVRKLKGEGRPFNCQSHRAEVLDALSCVSGVMIFNEKRITKWLRLLKPDVWIKGGDYAIDSLNVNERRAAAKVNCQIRILSLSPAISTTKLYEKIKRTLA